MIRILFIDNDLASLVLFKELCSLHGFQYIGIHNSLHVEKSLPGLAVDIVFLDLEMPGLSGFEVLPLLRTQPSTAKVPIVACTVFTNAIDKARNSGFNSFIAKPINVDLFSERVRLILQGHTFWDSYS